MAFSRVRVRLAPSPTGDPHVGTAYVALFNYAFAKKMGGDMILRIEDTDQVRARSSSEAMILRSLKWLGLAWDEGPDVGGKFGPYRQSERRAIHQEHANILLAKGAAYRCFCTAERLDEMRKKQREAGQTTGYDRHCRELPEAEVKAKLAAGVSHVVRLKMPVSGVTVIHDLLRGAVEFDNARIDDQVLLKSDGYPTYHLANVVDDHLMQVSHVIRAEEWVSSTPKHVALYEAFGWEKPTFAHLPLLRNADKSKISKRKNPTSLRYYERAGILPEAMLNFLALMGWSYGDDIELFSLAQMIERFDLAKVNLGGPIFDQTKLSWMNNQYLQKLDEPRFVSVMRDQVFSPEYLAALRPLVLERMERLEQFVDAFAFFFNGALNYASVPLVPQGKTEADIAAMAGELAELLDEVYDWDVEHLKNALDAHKAKLGWKPKDYFMTLRLILTGRKDSPPLVESMVVLGREMVRFRLRDVLRPNGPLAAAK
jgi:glutamyl-tRNA synthetase